MEYSFFANEQAFASALLLIAGGLIGVVPYYNNFKGIQQFTVWQICAFSLVAGCVIFCIEYPRGKRRKGQSVERKHQHCFSVVLSHLGVFGRNYYIRFIFYLLTGVACVFHIASVLGGLCLVIASLVYLVAAVKGEAWQPVERAPEEGEGKRYVAEAPSQPPPRRPAAPPAAAQKAASAQS